MTNVNTSRRTLSQSLALALGMPALASWPLQAIAQAFNKPLRILVGASAGGGTDVLARLLAEKMGAGLKQSVVVENKPGASNTLAADMLAKAVADGTSMLMATNTGQAIAPHLLKLAYDPLKNIQAIGLVAVVPNVLVVNSQVAAKDLKELVAMIKAKPGSFQYASSGAGSTQHIAGEIFEDVIGSKLLHIPYKGSAQAHLDLIGGSVQMMFDTTSSAMPHIKSGKLRALAVTSKSRSAELPDVPTTAELGLAALEMTTWYGLYTTGGVPKPVLEQLAAEFKRSMALPEVQARIKTLGGEPGSLVGDDFARFNQEEFERFGKLIRAKNIRVE
jgi:tripartite-type tricarboxylate transporter receptor subunit TctC